MIYTVTLNPSIDYIMNTEKFEKGRVNRSQKETIFAGGKGINVSKVLKNLGSCSCALGFVSGFTGEYIEGDLKKFGIRTDFINSEKGFSRINVKLKGKEETEINGCGPEISESEKKDFLKKIKCLCDGDTIVLAGSVPSGFSKSFYKEILEIFSEKNIKAVVDAEKELLLDTLSYKPFLIKPNIFELEGIFGEKLNSDEKIIEKAMCLKKRGARNVIVSLGGDGGIFVCENNKVYFCPAPKGRVLNTTGAGDSLVAGFLNELENSGDFEKAFIKGICAGSASAFSEDFASREEVERLYNEVKNKIEIMK